MPASERRRELKRRRHRRKKVELMKRRLDKATLSEKNHFAEQLRKLTPGADVLIDTLQLEERA